jgi:hypothetical protein
MAQPKNGSEIHCRRCDDGVTPPGVQIPEVRIAVDGERITVTMPGTNFAVDFFKRPDGKGIVQSEITETDSTTRISRHDFETVAWEAANRKARELGWAP